MPFRRRVTTPVRPPSGKEVAAISEALINLYVVVDRADFPIDEVGLWKMAGTTGLEPATSAVTGQRSNQLNYVPRVEPESPKWRAVEGVNQQSSAH